MKLFFRKQSTLENSVSKKIVFFSIVSHGNNFKIDNFLVTWIVWFCERMQWRKTTNYKSKVQKTIRFWISFLKVPQVSNKEILKLLFFAPKFFRKPLDFDGILLQRVKVWVSNFTNRQILKKPIYNASNFESMMLNCVRNQANVLQLVRFASRFLQRIRLWNNLFTTPQFLNRKNYKAPDFRKSLISGEQTSLEFRILKDNFWWQFTP